jgi:hypothetical protein
MRGKWKTGRSLTGRFSDDVDDVLTRLMNLSVKHIAVDCSSLVPKRTFGHKGKEVNDRKMIDRKILQSPTTSLRN